MTARKTERNESELWYHFYFWQQGRQKETNQNSDIISNLDSKEETNQNSDKQGRQKETNQNSDIISIFDSKEDRKKRIRTLISFLFLTARKTERNKSELWYHFYFWQQGRQKETNQNSDIISIFDSKDDRKKQIKTLISFLFLTARKTERNKSNISIFDSKEDRKKQIRTLSFLI